LRGVLSCSLFSLIGCSLFYADHPCTLFSLARCQPAPHAPQSTALYYIIQICLRSFLRFLPPTAITTSANIPDPLCSTSYNLRPLASSDKHACPNKRIHYPLFTPHSLLLPVGQLRAEGWEKVTAFFPEGAVTFAISGICRFGARIGLQSVPKSATLYPNLSAAKVNTPLVTSDIATEMSKNRLVLYQDREALLIHYSALPLGLTDKADSSRRRIHHLSYPALDNSSINGGIPEHYVTIPYSGIANTF